MDRNDWLYGNQDQVASLAIQEPAPVEFSDGKGMMTLGDAMAMPKPIELNGKGVMTLDEAMGLPRREGYEPIVQPPLDEHKNSIIKNLGLSIYSGASRGAAGFNERLLDLAHFTPPGQLIDALGSKDSPFANQINRFKSKARDVFVGDALKNADEISSQVKLDANPALNWTYAFMESVGNMGVTIPVDMTIGKLTKVAMAGKVIPALEKALSVIPDFALGAGWKAFADGFKGEGTPIEKSTQAVTGGLEAVAINSIFGSAGSGGKGIALMASMGAGEAYFNAAKEGRLPTQQEIFTSTTNAAAMGALFHILPHLKEATKIPAEKLALGEYQAKFEKGLKEGDITKLQEDIVSMVQDKRIRPEIKKTLIENLLPKQTEGVALDQAGKPIEIKPPEAQGEAIAPQATIGEAPNRFVGENLNLVDKIITDVSAGTAGRKYVTMDEVTGEVIAAGYEPSDFPEYFRDRGYTKKNIVQIMNNAKEGKLTPKQEVIYNEIITNAKEYYNEIERAKIEGVTESQIAEADRIGEEQALSSIESSETSGVKKFANSTEAYKFIDEIEAKGGTASLTGVSEYGAEVSYTSKESFKAMNPEERGMFESGVYKRLKAEHPTELTSDASAEAINLRNEAKKALDLIARSPQNAYEVAMGIKDAKEYEKVSTSIALADMALKEGNASLYNKLTLARSFEQTERAQALGAERGSVTDNSVNRYYKEILDAKIDVLGNSFLKDVGERVTGTKKSNKERVKEVIDKEAKKLEKQIKNKNLDIAEAQKLLDSLICK